ncbi:MAG: hypothetical protein AAFY88_05995 [Acidobacteriota bacterium]
MFAATAHERLRGALRAELNRHFGRIGEIEQGLGRAEGYLSKYCRGELSIPVDVFLKTLELLQIDPGPFFAGSLGAPPSVGFYLAQVMSAEKDKGLVLLEEAAVQAAHFESGSTDWPFEPPPETPPGTAVLLQEIHGCTAIEQRRRLRSAKKYRTTHFARAYLKNLLGLAYGDPKTAWRQAEVVGTDLIPQIEDCHPGERLELILRSMMVWAFAHRLTDAFEQAATAVHAGLALAERYGLQRIKGELLKIGAFVLVDLGRFDECFKLLNEALVVFDDLGDDCEVSKLHVQRAGHHLDTGDHLSSIRLAKRALGKLSPQVAEQRVYCLAAYQYIAASEEALGNLLEAEQWLVSAMEILDSSQIINYAKLVWTRAKLAEKRGDLLQAEANYREALRFFVECQAGECTLAALGLARLLLNTNQQKEAVELARSMSHLISTSRTSQVDQGALVEFVRTAVEGELTTSVVSHLAQRLDESQNARSTA